MQVYIKLTLTAIFWGGTFIAGKSIAANVGPYSASFLRFVIASTMLTIIVWKFEGRLPKISRRQILPVIALGLTGVFSYNIFFFKGLRLIEAGRASLIIANNPIFIALLSALIYKEKLTAVKIIGILISVSGALVVISRGHPFQVLDGGVGLGEFFIFCCVLSWVTYSLLGKAVMSGLSPMVSVAYSSIAGAIALLPTALMEGIAGDMAKYTVSDWLCLFYLGFFGTVLGFVWYYEGINKLGPTKAGLFINIVPISAVTLAFLILGEPVTISLFVGAVLVISGVYLTNRNPVAKPSRLEFEGRHRS